MSTLSFANWQPSEEAKALLTVLLVDAQHAAAGEKYNSEAVQKCKTIVSIARQSLLFSNNENLPFEKHVASVASREDLLQGKVSHEIEAGIRLAIIVTDITQHASPGFDPIGYMIDPLSTFLEKKNFSVKLVGLLSEAIDRNTTFSIEMWRIAVPFFI